MINLDRKWIVIEPTMTLGVGHDDQLMPWTNNSYINLNRVLKAKRYNVLSSELRKDRADAYYLISLINRDIDKEIEFVHHAHSQGSKVVLAISIDGRFLSGLGLCDPVTGTTHTELCNVVDVIASGVPDNVHIYGKNQHKVFSIGDFVENINFSTKPFENRTINLLGTGNANEATIPFNVILFDMIKSKYPDSRLVYALRDTPDYAQTIEYYSKKYPFIEWSQAPFPELLKDTRCYINIEPRPRAGRAVLEAWYHRVPSISCDSTYFSKLYPELSFHDMSFDGMVGMYEKVTESYNSIMQKADSAMEYDYAQSVYKRMADKLDGK